MAPFPLTQFLVNQMGPAYPVDRPSSKWFRTRICIILILDFLHSLSFLFSPSPIYGSGLPLVDFLPWDRPQHLQVFKKPPIIYFIPLSCPPSPLLIQLAHLENFHPARGFSFTRRVTGSTGMCRDPWMRGLNGSRATDLTMMDACASPALAK